MNNKYITYIKNIIIPCTLVSAAAGAFTGILIFFFKLVSSKVISVSEKAYSYVRLNPEKLPILLLGVLLISFLSALILKYSKDCRGGGIPTSVAILRGLISFSWVKSIFLLFISALSTYLCGIPLGNEGPSVQMGTAVGKGVAKIFPKKNSAWNRYIMTGGASAGFAAATGAPVSGIFFALEEAHRRFTPMIIMVASTAVISGSAVTEILANAFKTDSKLFEITVLDSLPLKYIWIAVICGIICGLLAGLFTKFYSTVNVLISHKLKKIPFAFKVSLMFLLTALIGFFVKDALGSGHSLMEKIFEGEGTWYVLALLLLIRLFLLIFANNIGITGGLFIPTLTFGAIIGAIIAEFSVSIGLIPAEYYVTVVVISVSSFMSAFVRTPITSVIFSVEALGAFNNILPTITAVTISYIIMETMALECFYDTVIESKIRQENAGKKAEVIDGYFTARNGSFIVGKEIRDILWPPNCSVLSVQKKNSRNAHSAGGIDEDDVLRIYVSTYDRQKTLDALESILGKQ